MKSNLFVSVSAVLLVVGCADPAENVPKASVSTNSSASADAGTTAGDGAKAAAATGSAAANPDAGAKAYAITPENSKVEFTGSKVTGKHDGGFKQLQGEVHVAGNAVQ